MTFANPLWLMGLVLLPLIVLLHVRRRRSIEVGSLLIWRRVARQGPELRTTAPRLPWNRHLLLQLLVVVLVVLAMAAPRSAATVSNVDHRVLWIDGSRTIAAADGTPDRRARAAGAAAAVLRDDGASTATVLRLGLETDAIALRRPRGVALAALEGFTTDDVDPDWQAAALLTAGLRAEGERMAITVVTDEHGAGAARAAAEAALPGVPVDVVSVGGAIRNARIVEASAVPPERAGRPWQLAGTVASDRLEPVEGVALRFEPEGTTGFLDWGTVALVPADDGTATFDTEVTLPGPGFLEIALASADDLPGDDRVGLWVGVTPPTRVLLVGPAEGALARALLAVVGVEVYRAADVPADTTSFDLVIVDRVRSTVVPSTSTMWVGTLPPGVPEADAVPITGPTAWRSDHVLTRPVPWSELRVDVALPLPVWEGADVLVRAGVLPIVQARTTDRGRQIALAFAVDDTTWPSLASFPSFVAAVVEWSHPGHGLAGVCRVGQACPLPRDAFAGEWRVAGPTGVVAPPSALTVASDPLAQRLWPGATYDRAFVPMVAGTYLFTAEGVRRRIGVWARATPLPAPADAQPPRPEGRNSWSFVTPAALVVALAAMLLDLWLAGRSRERFLASRAALPAEAVRRRAVLGLMAGAGLLLVAAIAALPLPVRKIDDRTVVLVDDATVSATGLALRDLCAAGARVVSVGPTPGLASSCPGHVRATDLVQALMLASDVSGAERLVVAAADVTGAGGDVAAMATRLAARGTVVDHIAEPPPAGLGLTLSAPAVVRSGDTVQLAVTLAGLDGGPVELVVQRDGEVIDERTLTIDPPGITLRIPVPVAAEGRAVVHVRADRSTAHDSDGAEANLVLEVGPPRRVALVGPDTQTAAALTTALELQGLVVRTVPFRSAPVTPDGWAAFEVVVLLDLPAAQFHSLQQEALAMWVRASGGGVVIVGGPNTYGPGGYFRTALEDLSPLSAQVPQEAPEVAFVFVLDRSGSMQQRVGPVTRMDIAKEAAIGALDLLAPTSEVGVVVFDSESRILVPMTPLSARDVVVEAVESIRANGGTSIHPALVDALALTRGTDVPTRHVVVMTDGLSQPGDFETVLRDLVAEGVTTSFVGIGEGADRSQLTTLARLGGGAFHFTRDFRALPGIMAQEAMMLSASPIETTRAVPVWTATDTFAELATVPAPHLDGLVRTSPKPSAVVHLRVPDLEGAPLLATWRYGAGRVAAFASQGAGPWVAAWLDWPEYPRFWSEVARWASQQVSPSGLSVRVTPTAGALHVSAILVEAGTTVGVPGAVLDAELVDPATGQVIARRTMLPVARGLQETTFGTRGREGLLEVRVAARGGGDAIATAAAVADERSGGSLLTTIARATAGRSIPVDDASRVVASSLRWRWQPEPHRGAWAAAALALYLAALLVRYAVWSWRTSVPASSVRPRAQAA